MGMEIRTYKEPIILRSDSGTRPTIDPLKGIIEGVPIVFEQRTDIGGLFFEEIAKGALDDADLDDVKLLVNHEDRMIPVARHRRGKRSTMEIGIEDDGMHIKANVDIENNYVSRALCSAVDRGDIEDMSFAFGIKVSGEEWMDLDKEMPIRRITKISRVFEVSAVNDGAYPQTSISARSADTLENAKNALTEARAAALENAKSERKSLDFEIQKFIFTEENR